MDKKREIALLALACAAFDFCDDHRFSPEMHYDGHFEEMVRAINYLRAVETQQDKEARLRETLVLEGELWEVGHELYIDWQAKNVDDVVPLRDALDNAFSFTAEKLPDGSEIYSYGKMRITIEKLDD